jgi:hypothetical protein
MGSFGDSDEREVLRRRGKEIFMCQLAMPNSVCRLTQMTELSGNSRK